MALGLLVASAAAPAVPPPVSTALERAVGWHRDGRLDDALSAYRSIAAAPGSAPATAAAARSNACAALNDLGRFEEALGECRAAEALRRELGDPALADTLNNLAGALDALGRGDEAEAAYLEALAAHRRAGAREDEALVLSNLAALAIGRGDLGRALGWIDDAERLALATSEPWGPGERAVARENRAVALERLGAYREALDELRAAAAARPDAADEPRAAATRALNLAVLLRNLGDPGRALAELERADRLLEPVDDRSTRATIALARGLVRLVNLEDPAGARAEFERALAEADAAGDRGEQGRARVGLGRAALAAGDAELAEREFAAALAVAEAAGAEETRWSALAGLGRAAAVAGDRVRALASLSAAIAAFERVGGLVANAGLREGLLADQREVYAAAVDLLVAEALAGATPDAAEALALAERSRARELLDAVGRPEGGGDPTEPLDADELRAFAREADGTALAYFAGESRLWRFRLDRHGVGVADAGAAARLLARALEVHGALASGGDVDPRALDELGRALLPPDLAEGLERQGALLVVPDAALFYLPFERLPFERPPVGAGAARADLPMLLDATAVAYSPSLSVLARRAPAPRGEPRWRLAAFADPVLDARPAATAALLARRFGLPALPGARREAERAARRLGGDTRVATGAGASEAALYECAREGARVLLVGAHTLIDERIAGGAAIFLASGDGEDGVVTPAELAVRPLAVELAILSGCRTALAGRREGRSLASISGALLGAGALGVVASLWEVEDRAAEALVDGLAWRLARGETPAEALRRAKLRLRDDPAWRGRQDWSAFVLLGDAPALAPRGDLSAGGAWMLAGLATAIGGLALALRGRARAG